MAAFHAGGTVRQKGAARLCALGCAVLFALCGLAAGAAFATPGLHHRRPECERKVPRPHHRKRLCHHRLPRPAAPPPPPVTGVPQPPLGPIPSAPQKGVLHSMAVAPPIVSKLRQSHRSWREGARPVHISSSRLAAVGSVFSFTLNEHAQVRFTFAQRVTGRRVQGSCAAADSANRSAPTCKRKVFRGALSFAAHAAANRVAFQGRLSRTRKLSRGVYELTIVATSAGQRSTPKTLGFTIVG